jgi:hypothetical protein
MSRPCKSRANWFSNHFVIPGRTLERANPESRLECRICIWIPGPAP